MKGRVQMCRAKVYRCVLCVIFLLCLLVGCGEVCVKKNQEQTREIYSAVCSEEEVFLLMKLLSCEREQAESIVRSMNRQNIHGVKKGSESIEVSEETGCWTITIEDSQGKTYLLYINRTFHLYAIQKDNADGEYIYQERE